MMHGIGFVRKPQGAMRENSMKNGDGSNLRFLTFEGFEKLEEQGLIRHCFSTREGGVSKGIYESMDLSFTMGDDLENVYENFDRLTAVIGTTKENIVSTNQQHTTNVRRVYKEDAGKGIVRPGFKDVDGLVTNERGLALIVFGADCVPVMLVDPVKKAIGVCHSGWRGTVGRIGENTVRLMEEEFGSRPEDIVCGIGPSICASCYEVSEDVAAEFRKSFPGRENEVIADSYPAPDGKEMKYKLDLWKANRIVLTDAGVKDGNICVTDICTRCNPGLLFSHRKAGRERGNNAGLLMMV